MPTGVDIDVEGIAPLVNRLSKFDKETYKILTKEVRQGLSEVAKTAKNLTPGSTALSGWGPWLVSTGQSAQVGSISLVQGTRDLSYDGASVRRKIRSRAVKRSQRGRVTSFSGQVVTTSAAGAIYSLAGSVNPNTPFARALRKAGRGTTWPRALTDARNKEGPQAAKAITEAIQRAAKAVETGRG